MEDSVFTKIIKGELPSNKVYEDDQIIAIIPLYPAAKGNVLVIPKVQIDQFIDLDSQTYQSLMAVVQTVARHMKAVLKTSRVGLKIEGLDVPHVHVKVIAFDNHAEFSQEPDTANPPDLEYNASLAKRLSLL